MPDNSEVAPMGRSLSAVQPQLAADATASVRFTETIGDVSLSVNGIATHQLPLGPASGRSHDRPMSKPGNCYLRMHSGEDAWRFSRCPNEASVLH